MSRRLCLFFFLALVLLVARLWTGQTSEKALPENTKISFQAQLTSSPRLSGVLQSFMIQVGSYEPIQVTTSSYPLYHSGQDLWISGNVKRKVIDGKRIVNTMYFPSIVPEKRQSIFYAIRMTITEAFEEYLPPDSARLLLGIVLGVKEPLSDEFHSAIQNTGLLHVIAASGMNVTLVVSGLVLILEKIFSRRMTICITLLAIMFYALFSGLQASIVRASLMGGLALIAGLLGKQYYGLWILFLTGYVMLFLDPSLLSDIGFQLSFMATLGIMLLKPLLAFPLLQKTGILGEDLTTSAAAQIMTFPIILSNFGQLNLISLLANVAILWMVAPLMILGGVAALCSLFSPALASVFLYLALPFLLLFEILTRFFSQFNLTIALTVVSVGLVTGYYLVVFWLIFLEKSRRQIQHHE